MQSIIKKSGFIHKLKKQRYLQAMAIPGVIWLLIFVYLPLVFIVIAFKEYTIAKPFYTGQWIGFRNFTEFFTDGRFFIVMKNTVGINFLRMILGFPIPIVFALLLSELKSGKYKRLVQTVSYLPHFLSWVILGGIIMAWLSDVGIVNDLLHRAGLIREPVAFIAKPEYFWPIVVISDIWKETGWLSIIYLAAIAGIDLEMYEAAIIDGAGRWHKIWNITLPSIKGTIVVLFILTTGYLLNSNFDQIFVLRNSLNMDASDVLDIYVYRMGIVTARYSYATAIGLFRSAIALVLLLVTNFVSGKLSDTSLF